MEYHKKGRPGKLEITPTTPLISSNDLSLAYSPGVATPCLEIEKKPDTIYDYTSKGNIVAVISNGTAVLGLAILELLHQNQLWKESLYYSKNLQTLMA